MIVGNKNIDLGKLRRVCKTEESLVNFCESLVPKYVRHISAIRDNQRYLVALHLRRIESIPFKEREYWSNYLTNDIRVTGLLNSIVDFNDLISHTDIRTLVNYITQENQNV